MNELSIEALRGVGMKVLLAGLAILALCTMIGSMTLGTEVLIEAVACLALLAGPGWMVWSGRSDTVARMTVAMSVVAMPAIMLYAFRGMAWQVDLHMLFFAALATTAILCDWRALVAGTLVVALHHLVVGLSIPEWVFGNGGSLGRVLIHAVILSTEAAALIFITSRMVALVDAIGTKGEEQRMIEMAATTERAAHIADLETATHALGQGLAALSKGDLSKTIDIRFPEAFVALRDHFNDAIGSLRRLVSGVASGTEGVRDTSAQIAAATQDLTARTERAAASIEETSAALTQIDQRLATTERTVSDTVSRADAAIVSVHQGRSVTDEAVQTMERVATSVHGIDSVIEGLDKIAFQTRVLAMNAAVEAGNAGDAGRGFAVVADLVGQLAMRSEEEAKRARQQLTATQTDVAGAVEAIGRVDGALDGISTSVDAVHGLLKSVAEDHAAQVGTLSQVTGAMSTLEGFTQQNAAMVEESNAAARALAAEVASVAELASQFKLAGELAQSPTRVAARTTDQRGKTKSLALA